MEGYGDNTIDTTMTPPLIVWDLRLWRADSWRPQLAESKSYQQVKYRILHLRNNDNTKIQPIPAIPQVRVFIQYKPPRRHF